VERVEELAGGRRALVLATANAPLVGTAEWPLTLVAEALAQAILLVVKPPPGRALRLAALHRVEIVQPWRAGDRFEVEVERLASFPPLHRYRCRALRAGGLAALAEVTVSG
jgi:hypothetical protein